MTFNIFSIFTIVVAFILCSLFFGVYIENDSCAFPDFTYHYQTLITGAAAIISAFIGGGFALRSVHLQREFKKTDFVSGQMQLLIDTYHKLGNLSLRSTNNARRNYKEIMERLDDGIEANTILRVVDKNIGGQIKTLIYGSTPRQLTNSFIDDKRNQILAIYGLLKLKTENK